MLVPAGVVAGLLLFLAVWLQRDMPQDESAATLPTIKVDSGRSAPRLPAPSDEAPLGEAPGGVFTLPDAPAEPPPAVAGEPASTAPPDPTLDPAPGDTGLAAVDHPAVPVRQPPPAYPRQALRRGESGEVLVRVVVGTDGRPSQVQVARSSSHRALDQAAVKAVRRWRFQPATRDGQSVPQTVHIPVDFTP